MADLFLTGLLFVAVVALVVMACLPMPAVVESTPKASTFDEHFATAAALLTPDAPIEPVWATALLADIAALPTAEEAR